MLSRSVAYNQHINSAWWRSFRQKALDHHGRKCAKCGGGGRLVVHHIHYRTFGRESLEDVSVLCEDCHNVLHGGSPRGKGRAARRKKPRQSRRDRYAKLYDPYNEDDLKRMKAMGISVAEVKRAGRWR